MEDTERAATVERIAERIEAGALTADACKAEGTSDATLRRWMAADAALRERCTRARSVAADALAEEAVAIATGTSAARYADAQERRLAYDALRWLAGKRRPHEYGDKATIEHTGTVGHLHLDALRTLRPASGATPDDRRIDATARIARSDNALRDTVAPTPHVDAGKDEGEPQPIATTGRYPGWGDPIAPPES